LQRTVPAGSAAMAARRARQEQVGEKANQVGKEAKTQVPEGDRKVPAMEWCAPLLRRSFGGFW